MAISVLVLIAVVVLVFMNRRDVIGNGEFAIAIVLLLSALAGFLGVSQY
ncbi:hypothetical protein ACV1MK_06660 [Klebsiella michiganensis]|nr:MULTISPECIES: hypothetical protein [Klebsiella]EKT7900116.1 hypothetical protein [Klebsiella oxytoca]MCE5368484.1 hypothetical protein [Klebsiella oxytoca]HDG9161027.1 hypothetical protein [Klebsiella pneumoniae]